MNPSVRKPQTEKHHLDEVLLAYLQDPHVTVWPGGDGLTVEEVLLSYPQAVAACQVPDRQELLTEHPECAGCADDLSAFFPEEE